jgi:hypothetical protein
MRWVKKIIIIFLLQYVRAWEIVIVAIDGDIDSKHEKLIKCDFKPGLVEKSIPHWLFWGI